MAIRVLVTAVAYLVLGSVAAAWEWPAQVQADYQKLGKLGKAGDLKAMEEFIRLRIPEWESLGGPWYGHLMLRAAQRLGTDPFEDRTQSRTLATMISRKAVINPSHLTLEDQVKLVRYIQVNLMEARQSDEWVQERLQDARLWLQTWKRVIDTIDPDWVRETVYLNIVPPLESGQRSGVAPEAVKDPKLRAEYEAALEENSERAERNLEQSRARRLAQTFLPRTKRYITEIYSHPPYAVKELEELLMEYVADEESRSEILSSVTSAIEAKR